MRFTTVLYVLFAVCVTPHAPQLDGRPAEPASAIALEMHASAQPGPMAFDLQ